MKTALQEAQAIFDACDTIDQLFVQFERQREIFSRLFLYLAVGAKLNPEDIPPLIEEIENYIVSLLTTYYQFRSNPANGGN